MNGISTEGQKNVERRTEGRKKGWRDVRICAKEGNGGRDGRKEPLEVVEVYRIRRGEGVQKEKVCLCIVVTCIHIYIYTNTTDCCDGWANVLNLRFIH